MEFLLILSALLSAATGALTGTRGPETGMRHEAAVETVAAAQSAASLVAPAQPALPSKPASVHRLVVDNSTSLEPAAKARPDTDRLIE